MMFNEQNSEVMNNDVVIYQSSDGLVKKVYVYL